MEENIYIKSLKASHRLNEKAIKEAINYIDLHDNDKILDVPCGIGRHSLWMLENNPSIKLTGVDYDELHLEHSKQLLQNFIRKGAVSLQKQDMNNLNFEENSFDIIWSSDGLWPGPKEIGCIAEEPYDILKKFVEITKPGGKIAVLFWSSQKFLPGYPFIESQLNTCKTANSPMLEKTDPNLHFMKTPLWFEQVGIKNLETKTFVADIGTKIKTFETDVPLIANMFWGAAESEVPKSVWQTYQKLLDKNSPQYLLNDKHYAGFLTYTLFIGEVVK